MSVSIRGPLAKRGAATLAVAAVIGLSACSSSPSSSSPAAGSASASGTASAGVTYAQAQIAKYESVSVPPAPAALSKLPDLKGKTVWFIPFVDAVPVQSATGAAMTAALGKLGATVHVCDGGALPTTIASCMNSAISQHAAAVVTGFIDYVQVPAGFQELEKAHIPVLVGGEAPTGGQTSSTSLAFFDISASINFRAKLEADFAIADSGGKADVLVTRLTDSATTEAAADAELSEFQAHCPDCTVHTIDMASADIGKYPGTVSSALTSDPSIDYITTPIDSYDSNALAGIRAAGFANKVKIVTVGADLSGMQEVSAGTTLADISNSVVYMGWAFANALLDMLSGKIPAPMGNETIKVFTKSNVAGLTLTPAAYATDDWYSSSDLEQGFLTAWGLK